MKREENHAKMHYRQG